MLKELRGETSLLMSDVGLLYGKLALTTYKKVNHSEIMCEVSLILLAILVVGQR